MSKKLVRATARALIAGCLIAATVVLGAGPAAADLGPGGNSGNSSNGNSWIGG